MSIRPTLSAVTKNRVVLSALALGGGGLLLIVAGNLFSWKFAKVQVDSLIAETGALLLVVGVLTWLFDCALRVQLLHDVSAAVAGSSALRDCGLTNCLMDGHAVSDETHWKNADELIIGRLHSVDFLKRHHEVLAARCSQRKPTTILVLDVGSTASTFLHDIGVDKVRQNQGVQAIHRLVSEIDNEADPQITVHFHDQVLRYSFVYTNERIWVKLYTNAPRTAKIPALEVRAGSPLFEFFKKDVFTLRKRCHDG